MPKIKVTTGTPPLKTQLYLRNCYKNKNKQGTPLEALHNDYAINVAYSPIGEGLVILNYDQIDSPKYSPIVRECRGLVLDANDDYAVVAKGFDRFFNYGESRAEINKFDWKNFSVVSKEDGSLILIYKYNGTWRVNTRGSFAMQEVGFSGKTWEELVRNLIDDVELEELDQDTVLVCELCTIHNKVVRTYPEPRLYLLAGFDKVFGNEYNKEYCDVLAERLGLRRPTEYEFDNIEDIVEYLSRYPDNTFEGFVLKDKNNRRMKIKNPDYIRLHAMRGNGDNMFMPKNLVPFILKNETDEIIAIFPEVTSHVERYKNILEEEYKAFISVWSEAKHLTSQKEFAIMVNEKTPKTSSLLFTARKTKVDAKQVWFSSEEFLIELVKRAI